MVCWLVSWNLRIKEHAWKFSPQDRSYRMIAALQRFPRVFRKNSVLQYVPRRVMRYSLQMELKRWNIIIIGVKCEFMNSMKCNGLAEDGVFVESSTVWLKLVQGQSLYLQYIIFSSRYAFSLNFDIGIVIQLLSVNFYIMII